MGRYDDIHPDHIDPETGEPYAGYSSPSIDTTLHDIEMDVDDEPTLEEIFRRGKWQGSDNDFMEIITALRRQEGGGFDEEGQQICTHPRGHSWVCRDDNEQISYCEWCGADGNA